MKNTDVVVQKESWGLPSFTAGVDRSSSGIIHMLNLFVCRENVFNVVSPKYYATR